MTELHPNTNYAAKAMLCQLRSTLCPLSLSLLASGERKPIMDELLKAQADRDRKRGLSLYLACNSLMDAVVIQLRLDAPICEKARTAEKIYTAVSNDERKNIAIAVRHIGMMAEKMFHVFDQTPFVPLL